MRGTLPVLAISAAVVLGLTVHANEKPTEAYQKAMKDMAASLQTLRAEVKTLNEYTGCQPDYRPIEDEAKKLKPIFASTLAFWTEKKADDAIKLAEAGLKAVADLEKALYARDFDGIDKGAQAIGATCAGCHSAHRERLPDGTFEIK